MKLSDPEIRTFFTLWYRLIWDINQKHTIVPNLKKPVYGERVDMKPIFAIREQLWENPQWIDEFLVDCDCASGRCNELTETERGILAGWRNNFIKGKFIIVKHTAKYSLFMPVDNLKHIYCVYGISEHIKEIASDEIPLMVNAVLLPFNGRIIYDGFLSSFNVSFGKGIREDLKMSYNETKEKIGIIEVIGKPPVPVKPISKKIKPQEYKQPAVDTKGAKIPKEMSSRYMEIAVIITAFCDEKLNAEYNEICLRALQKLCRKRSSASHKTPPLISGKARTWACGIIYAIGSVNFIFDKTQPINLTAAEIAEWFELSKSTASNKAAEINKLLDLSYFNTEFLLKDLIDNNPAIWFLNVDGLIVDIRDMPYELQEEAFRKGLIPYIPGDVEQVPLKK